MAWLMTNMHGHAIQLHRKGDLRAYKVTRQFQRQHIHATASLFAVSQYADHKTMAGFIECQAANGYESFGHNVITGTSLIAGHRAPFLWRESVRLLRFELLGSGGAGAHFQFHVFERAPSGSSGGSAASNASRAWSDKPSDYLFGFDRDSGLMTEIEEIYGDARFTSRQVERLVGTVTQEVKTIPAPKGFVFDPGATYALTARGTITERPRRAPRTGK